MKIGLKKKLEVGVMDAIVIPVCKGKDLSSIVKEYPELSIFLQSHHISANAGDSFTFLSSTTQCPIILVGVGKGDTGRISDIVKCTKKIVATLEQHKIKKAVMHLVQDISFSREFWQSFIDFLYLHAYSFDRYMNRKEQTRIHEFTLYSTLANTTQHLTPQFLERQEKIHQSVVLARDLVNESPTKINPDSLVTAFQALSTSSPLLSVSVWRKEHLISQGLQGILAVGKASPFEPALVRVSYHPPKTIKTIALVGKGITFDAGGLNIKTGNSMAEMKCDMSGAAAVLGIMVALPHLNIPIQVEALVPIAENIISAVSFKPGDIISFKNKKTVEIINTDAEGRLLLADALILATSLHPDYIIELSTLTGGVISALGDNIAGIMGNHKKLLNLLLKAGQNTGERLWQLPLVDDYRESLKSKIADLKNCGYGPPQTIKAALFLNEFVAGTPFAHIDIAGTAFLSKPCGFYNREGATGFGVRLLIEYLTLLST